MRRALLNALIFGLAPLLQRLAGIVLLPLYTHFLTQAQYGEIELLSIALGLVGLLARLEVRTGFIRAWVDNPGVESRGGLLRSTLLLLGGTGVLGAAIVGLGSGAGARWWLGHEIGWALRLTLAASLFGETLAYVCQAALQAEMASARMVLISLLQFVTSATVTAYGVVVLQGGPAAFFFGGAAGYLVSVPVMLAWLAPALRARGAAGPALPRLMRFSLPLLAGALLFFVVRNTDRLAVGAFRSTAELGIYAMAWTLANLLSTMVFQPLLTSYEVWRHEVFRGDGDPVSLARFTQVVMLILGLGAVGLTGFGGDAFALVSDPRFHDAVRYLPVLTAAVMVQAGYSFVNAPFYATGATVLWLRIFCFGAVTQVGLSAMLVPRFGLVGAALAILSANMALYCGAAGLGRGLWRIPWRHGSHVAVLAIAGACMAGRALWAPAGISEMVVADGVCCAAYLIAVWGTGLLRAEDVGAALGGVGGRGRFGWLARAVVGRGGGG